MKPFQQSVSVILLAGLLAGQSLAGHGAILCSLVKTTRHNLTSSAEAMKSCPMSGSCNSKQNPVGKERIQSSKRCGLEQLKSASAQNLWTESKTQTPTSELNSSAFHLPTPATINATIRLFSSDSDPPDRNIVILTQNFRI
jgi:hypothetical protein